MNFSAKKYLSASIIVMLPIIAHAETTYIIDRIQVGIHDNSNLDSPILKVIATGAQLQIVQSGVDMTQVEDPDGTVGWISTAYLTGTKPGEDNNNATNSESLQLQSELEQAKNEINQLKADLSAVNNIPESRDLTSLRLKVGELQAKLTEERKVSSGQENQNISGDIQQVEEENKVLTQTISELNRKIQESNNSDLSYSSGDGFSKTVLLLVLLFGLVSGTLLYDLYNRYRHGGFRV